MMRQALHPCRSLLLLAAMPFVGCAAQRLPVRSVVPFPPAVDATLLLIGDAGKIRQGRDPVLEALSQELKVSQADSQTTVVFLGDNIYPRGLPDSNDRGRSKAEQRIDHQIDVVLRSKAKGLFIPGNHDWARHGDDGWEAVQRQASHVDSRGEGRVRFLPLGGCPGPEVLDVGEKLRLIILDTQWWLHGGPKPRHPSSSCSADSESEIVDSLKAALSGAGSRHVIVLAHHPLRSGGEHGGHFAWTDHIFPLRHLVSWLWLPLPVLGSAYPMARKLGINSQDIPSGENRSMRRALERAFADHPPLAYVSGHEHNLQVLTGKAARYLLISGGGSFDHQTPVSSLSETRWAKSTPGFMRLDILKEGRVHLRVYSVDEAKVTEYFLPEAELRKE